MQWKYGLLFSVDPSDTALTDNLAASVLRNQNYADGVRLLMRYAAACDAADTPSSLCRAYLGAIVVQLYAENATEAWQIYQACPTLACPKADSLHHD